MSAPTLIPPGTVLAVRGSGWTGSVIRFFSGALEGEPNIDAHIAVVHHYTGAVPWCIEGRPGGVGWRDGRDYLRSRYTVTNADQPLTVEQRALICKAMEVALGTSYDWAAIALDAADALDLPHLWATDWNGTSPGHLVCSSLAAWGYLKGKAAHPVRHSVRETTPPDWTQFMLDRAWTVPAASAQAVSPPPG